MSSEGPITVPVDPDSRRWTESYKEKLIRKTKENPLVPIGTLITAGAMIMASIRLRQRDSKKFQVWLRYRVAFQGLTILAVLGGLYKYGQGNLEENQKVMEEMNRQRSERKLAEERMELEQRIASAAQAHEEEQLGKVVTVKEAPKPASSSGGILSMVSWGSRAQRSGSEQPEEPKVSPVPQSPASSNSGASWWNVFSWGRSNSSPNVESSSKKDS